MTSAVSFVSALTDEELYKELLKHGVTAGPVVASTRRLYRNKLIEILQKEGSVQQAEEEEEKEEEEEDEEESDRQWNQPNQGTRFSSQHSRFSQETIAPVRNVSQSSPYYRHVEENKTHIPSQFSYSGSEPSARMQGSSWLSRDSPQNYESSSRFRKSFPDTPIPRPETSPRYRRSGYSDEFASRLRIQTQPRSSSSFMTWLTVCAAILVPLIIIYILYNTWSENDPYQQIEEEALKFIEETKNKGRDV